MDQRGYRKQDTSPRPKVMSADHLLRVLKHKRSNSGVRGMDNERRLMYGPNFDRWAALVLAATSFRTERSALSDGIFRHLTFRAHFDFASDLALNKEKRAGFRTEDRAIDFDWPRRTCSILAQLFSTLSATLYDVRKYEQAHELCLRLSEASDSSYYKEIRLNLKRTCDGLRDCQRSLGALREILILEQDHVQTNRSLHLARNQNKDLTRLSWVTLVSQPLVIAAAIFSCGGVELALPRISPTILFLALLLCTSAAIAAIVIAASRRALSSSTELGISRQLVADIGPARDRDENDNRRHSPFSLPILELPALRRSDMLAFTPRRKIQ
ncbi:hypothetical protein JMJ77_0012630 [Colletotrichum scovillei]|uniref:Uncharacterized protein n=1 Tax=Colletotrichum scovillei TaxID=1209932 RepID=A0A9P7R446_9PEZI|nr:hypothetical protein JMJ77_0012630 [Colletotrichum scovillei]KAG7068909.1 hypothetical protein JMJ76_0002589 [Colletotrichum scovillei]KAG7072864.1 hypothetical protein JMJ78_0013849 [Colletotrichum scovillei]